MTSAPLAPSPRGRVQAMWILRLAVALAAVAAGVVLTGGQTAEAAEPSDVISGIAAAALPALARQSLPLISDLTATECPELPPLWVVAQVQAESGWDPGAHSDQPGGSAGLYQLSQAAWVAAGGSPWAADPPAEGAAVLRPETHLRVAIPWICANLRAVTAHLAATGKPTTPLDAMLVCHVAGCARVTDSRDGVPAPGEAGCDDRCSQLIHRYLVAVHDNLARFGAEGRLTPPSSRPTPAGPRLPDAPYRPAFAATAWAGGATGCRPPDPTGNGCLTGATRHGLDAVGAAFGGWHDGPVVRAAGCWDRHAWNPSSDHSRGKACDFMVTQPGTFAQGTDRDNGWEVASWLRANAGPLQVKYLIWQGRYWDPGVRDDAGNWGIRYTGGGIYDVRSATGGHFDHVHASFRE